jgi:uncharacterized protein with FMN-binding domain
MEEPKKNNGVVMGVVFALIVAVGAYGFFKYTKKEDATVTPTPSPSVTTATTVPPITDKYKNGTYSAVGNYNSPGGAEEVGVELTIKDDVVTAVTVTPRATRPTSVTMQTLVKNNVGPLVIGVKLDEIALTKVSGSSLTPKGFMDAVAKIKLKAAA